MYDYAILMIYLDISMFIRICINRTNDIHHTHTHIAQDAKFEYIISSTFNCITFTYERTFSIRTNPLDLILSYTSADPMLFMCSMCHYVSVGGFIWDNQPTRVCVCVERQRGILGVVSER